VHNDRILTCSLLCYAPLVTFGVNGALEMTFMNHELWTIAGWQINHMHSKSPSLYTTFIYKWCNHNYYHYYYSLSRTTTFFPPMVSPKSRNVLNLSSLSWLQYRCRHSNCYSNMAILVHRKVYIYIYIHIYICILTCSFPIAKATGTVDFRAPKSCIIRRNMSDSRKKRTKQNTAPWRPMKNRARPIPGASHDK